MTYTVVQFPSTWGPYQVEYLFLHVYCTHSILRDHRKIGKMSSSQNVDNTRWTMDMDRTGDLLTYVWMLFRFSLEPVLLAALNEDDIFAFSLNF
jgi:hypothetical protein